MAFTPISYSFLDGECMSNTFLIASNIELPILIKTLSMVDALLSKPSLSPSIASSPTFRKLGNLPFAQSTIAFFNSTKTSDTFFNALVNKLFSNIQSWKAVMVLPIEPVTDRISMSARPKTSRNNMKARLSPLPAIVVKI